MTKPELRKIYLKKRAALSEAQCLDLSHAICDNFFRQFHFANIKVLHTFLPIQKNKEVNTWLIIDRIREAFPDIAISIPKVNNQSASIDNFYFEKKDQIEINLWGIPEPKYGLPTPADKIDAVLVPLLAFDKLGNRVGYGGGFYDKFLATCRPDCRKSGLSFFEMEEKIEGIDAYDVPLNMIITPKTAVFI